MQPIKKKKKSITERKLFKKKQKKKKKSKSTELNARSLSKAEGIVLQTTSRKYMSHEVTI